MTGLAHGGTPCLVYLLAAANKLIIEDDVVPPGPIAVSGLNIVINVRRYYSPYIMTAIFPIVSCSTCPQLPADQARAAAARPSCNRHMECHHPCPGRQLAGGMYGANRRRRLHGGVQMRAAEHCCWVHCCS